MMHRRLSFGACQILVGFASFVAVYAICMLIVGFFHCLICNYGLKFTPYYFDGSLGQTLAFSSLFRFTGDII